ncbi:unnamed protein product [Adineta ricciae]|uniref:Uncharacterized protein n=1 Tax=Adineta ricciae TaxID=249248 RepID=A0A813QR13_ADIRI|nr:unnamed protein product [Adineta ricciae]
MSRVVYLDQLPFIHLATSSRRYSDKTKIRHIIKDTTIKKFSKRDKFFINFLKTKMHDYSKQTRKAFGNDCAELCRVP